MNTASTEREPSRKNRMPRYAEVKQKSGIFSPNALDVIIGTKL
jgi:hypothetical protein